MLCYLPPFAEKLNFNDNFLLVRDRLKKVKPLLQAYGLKLGLEFIGPTETRLHSKYDFIHTIDGVRCLIASADLYGLAGFKLDVHHWENSGAGLLGLKHLDIDYVLYVELNDGKIGYDRFTIPEFARELPLATHVTHVIEFLSELAKKDYAGPVTVEPWNEAIQQMGLEEAIKIVKASLDTVLHQAGIVKKLSAL
jgi:sugar phosphate isomerase/epimerase